MARLGNLFSRHTLSAASLVAVTVTAGCSSVEHTPMDKVMAVQTVVPLAKPGTETTAYALPPAEGVATLAASAYANDQKASGAVAALAATAPTSSSIPVPEAATVTVSPAPSKMPPMPTVAMTAMESDFDIGEPVGLENIVPPTGAIPVPRPGSRMAALGSSGPVRSSVLLGQTHTSNRPEMDRMISRYAQLNGIPESLLHRVVKRESRYNPKAYNRGHYGLMQIKYNTAKSMGYEGEPAGLFDAETNLKYATKYLRGAWLVADDKNDGAVMLYASGYYNHAKRKGLLEEAGLR